LLEVYEKACKKLTLLKGLKFKVNRNTLSLLYKSLIRPVMEYADVLWDGRYEKESDLLESVQCEAAKTVTGAIEGTNRGRLLCDVGWETMKTRRQIHKLILLYKILMECPPNTSTVCSHNKLAKKQVILYEH